MRGTNSFSGVFSCLFSHHGSRGVRARYMLVLRFGESSQMGGLMMEGGAAFLIDDAHFILFCVCKVAIGAGSCFCLYALSLGQFGALSSSCEPSEAFVWSKLEAHARCCMILFEKLRGTGGFSFRLEAFRAHFFPVHCCCCGVPVSVRGGPVVAPFPSFKFLFFFVVPSLAGASSIDEELRTRGRRTVARERGESFWFSVLCFKLELVR